MTDSGRDGHGIGRRSVLAGLLAAALVGGSRSAAGAGRPEVLVHKSPT
jgi:hypothetical protein